MRSAAILPALAGAIAVAACGSGKSSSPISPSAIGSVTSVSLTFAAPHTAAIHTDETVQFAAKASFSDGTTADCTEAATWSTSDAQVLKVTGARGGQMIGVGAGAATITAMCGPVSGSLNLTVAAITKVTLSAAAGHSGVFTAGERSQLHAMALYGDGVTVECSASGVWSSANANVVRIDSGAGGSIEAVASGATTIDAACQGVHGSLAVTVGPGVRLTGIEDFPYFVLLGGSIYLQASLVDGHGGVIRNCTQDAVWSTSDRNIARMGFYRAGLGQFFVKSHEGEVTITAACGDSTGQIRILIDHFTLRGSVRSAAGVPLPDASVAWGFPALSTDASGAYAGTIASPDPAPYVHKNGYETIQQTVLWDRQPAMTHDFTLMPLSGIFRQGGGTLCSDLTVSDAECRNAGAVGTEVAAFTAPHAGTLRFTSHWDAWTASEIDSDLLIRLTCNGAAVSTFPRRISRGYGDGFTITADTNCQYEMTIQNATTSKVLPYQWTLNMQ